MSTTTTFASALASITREVKYNKEWENGTGYLDHAVTDHTLGLRPGERVKTVDDIGRNIIIVGTPVGNAVFFQRHTPDDSYEVIVSNAPIYLGPFIPNGALSQRDQSQLFLHESENIGRDIANLLKTRVQRCAQEWAVKIADV